MENWKENVTTYLNFISSKLSSNEEAKFLYYGFNAIDGELKLNPKILFIGINPGKGNGESKYAIEIESGGKISYLDHLDKEYHYHLAKTNIDLLKEAGLSEKEIYELLKNECVKTNFDYIITNNRNDLKKVHSFLNKKEHFHKCCELTIKLIKLIKPKIVIFEGKEVYENIVLQCYEIENSWSKENDFGYYFSTEDNSHFIGYSRIMSNLKSNKIELGKKLKECLFPSFA